MTVTQMKCYSAKKVKITIFSTRFCLQYFTAGNSSTDIISSIRQTCCSAANCEVHYCTNTKKAFLQHMHETFEGGGIMPSVWLFRIY